MRLYGYLLYNSLKNINYLKNIDDDNLEVLIKLNIGLDDKTANEIVTYNTAVKKKDMQFVLDQNSSYIEKVKRYFLPKGYIPYNAIILLTVRLFEEYPQILSFYRSYFYTRFIWIYYYP